MIFCTKWPRSCVFAQVGNSLHQQVITAANERKVRGLRQIRGRQCPGVTLNILPGYREEWRLASDWLRVIT